MTRHYLNQALACLQSGQLDEAARLCQLIRSDDPLFGAALHLQAVIASMRQDFDLAATLALRAACFNPDDVNFMTDLSALAHYIGLHDLAVSAARRALMVNPNHRLAQDNFRVAEDGRKRRHELALSDLAQGINRQQSGDAESALAAFARACRHDPNLPDAQYGLGSLYLLKGEDALACDHLARAICLHPAQAYALGNLGTVRSNQKEYAGAVHIFQRAISIVPNYLDGHYNLANALAQLGRFEDSIISFQRGLCLVPAHQQSLVNMAASFHLLCRHRDIGQAFNRALRLDPDDHNCAVNLSFCQLSLGDFENGWENYERRQSALDLRGGLPVWDGSDLGSDVLLIRFEQGIGDTLQFIRFARFAKLRTKNIIVQVQKSVKALIARAYPELIVLGSDDPAPKHEAIIAMMSLPRLFGINARNIPDPKHYLFADPSRVDFWSGKLSSTPRMRIGIAWSGNPDLKNDHLRSTQLLQWQDLLGMDDIEFHVLQFPIRDSDRQHLSRFKNLIVHPPELMGFDDTAALIMHMDLIITIDTSIAHLAAALGRQTWILLAYMCDWRWMLERPDTPWYESARLFRQHDDRSWQTVMSDIRQALLALQ